MSTMTGALGTASVCAAVGIVRHPRNAAVVSTPHNIFEDRRLTFTSIQMVRNGTNTSSNMVLGYSRTPFHNNRQSAKVFRTIGSLASSRIGPEKSRRASAARGTSRVGTADPASACPNRINPCFAIRAFADVRTVPAKWTETQAECGRKVRRPRLPLSESPPTTPSDRGHIWHTKAQYEGESGEGSGKNDVERE